MISNQIIPSAAERKQEIPFLAEIQNAVAQFYGISRIEILSDRRHWARHRQVAMFLCRELTSHSLPAIGRAFSRDHTTIWHGIRTIERLVAERGSIDADVQAIKRSILW